jgi:hypothetical protein
MLFRPKIIEESALADVSGIGNVLDSGFQKAAFGKQPERGAEKALAVPAGCARLKITSEKRAAGSGWGSPPGLRRTSRSGIGGTWTSRAGVDACPTNYRNHGHLGMSPDFFTPSQGALLPKSST